MNVTPTATSSIPVFFCHHNRSMTVKKTFRETGLQKLIELTEVNTGMNEKRNRKKILVQMDILARQLSVIRLRIVSLKIEEFSWSDSVFYISRFCVAFFHFMRFQYFQRTLCRLQESSTKENQTSRQHASTRHGLKLYNLYSRRKQ